MFMLPIAQLPVPCSEYEAVGSAMMRTQAQTQGQLENTETRERKREREGTSKTEVNILDRAAHNKAIEF